MRTKVDFRARHRCAIVVLVAGIGMALPSLAETRPADPAIEACVRHSLRNDPRVAPSGIDATAHDGIVTLRGTVPDIAARQFADLETKKIAGVRGVVDELNVRPSDRTDPEIRADILARFRGSATPGVRQLDADVEDGIATLRGAVGSWGQKQQAELLASEVRGVRAVDDEITLDYESSRPDAAIRTDIVDALARDVYLEGLPIEVAVLNGKVTLTGSVGNAYERDRATEAAWVPNVESVENDVKVKWVEQQGVRQAAPKPDDAEVAKAVKIALDEDLTIADPFAIHVAASAGDVTLRGTVPTYDQKLRAAVDARDVVGVAWVRNRLVVRAGWESDSEIRKEVLARLDEDYLLNDRGLEARVHDGIVTLSGSTRSYRGRDHAIDVASRVPGVVEVVDHVSVEGAPRVGDEELAAEVRDRLSHDAETRWVADRIDVEVNDGVVELTGDVSSWGERREAGRLAALTDGVRGVDNRLSVQGVAYPWRDWYDREGQRFGSYVMPSR